jgi:hypothetical protein
VKENKKDAANRGTLTRSMSQGTKRSRTQHDAAQAKPDRPGSEQLLFTSPELQTRLGQKYCDDAQLLPLLLAHGLVRRVRTIAIEVRPLGGDSFMVTLDTAAPTVGEAKAEIARVQGTEVARQELYRVAVREDGGAVREDDAEPELLDDDTSSLEEGAVVAMAVKEVPWLWRTFSDEHADLTQGGTVATHRQREGYGYMIYSYLHITTGFELTEGRHYWEVELLSIGSETPDIYVGVSRPNLPLVGGNFEDDWFIGVDAGYLCGNGKDFADEAGDYKQGDRVGLLLDLNNGSLLFFKNGIQHGPGYPAGSVTGSVVAAVASGGEGEAVRLHAEVAFPAGHVQ